MANIKTFTGGSKASSPWREIRIVLTETATSSANNTSTVAWEVWLDNGNTYFNTVKIGCRVVIDGTTVLDRAYGSSEQYSCGQYSSVKIAQGTATVAHGSDGKKTIAAGQISAACSSSGIVDSQTVTSNAAWALADITRASTITISTNTTILGQTRTITISRASSSFTHTLTYSFGSASGTIAAKTTATSVPFTPAASLAAQLTNAASGTGTITCQTFNGNALVGTTSVSFTGKIPASTFTVGSATVTMGNNQTFAITRAASNLTHKLTYGFGSLSGQVIGTGFGTGATWQVPKALAAELTNAASGSVRVALYTYNGTAQCGSPYVLNPAFTAKIPVSTVTASPTAAEMGGNVAFTIARAAANLTHTMTYSFGSLSGQSIGTGIGASKTWPVPASLAAQLSNASSGTCTVTTTTFNGSATVGTSTTTLTLKIPASTFTVGSASVNMGSNQTFTITRAASNLNHKLTYAFGSLSGQVIGTDIGTSKTWQVPKNLAAQIANAASGPVRVALYTYNGTAQCGSTYVLDPAFTVVIPASTVSTSAASDVMGTIRKITIDRASSNLTHKVTYTFNAASGTIAAAAGTNVDWSVPTALAAQVSSGSSHRYGTISCETFNGSASCGTKTVSFRADIPASTVTPPAEVWKIGSIQTIKINRASSNLTHTLTYSFGSTSDAAIGSGVGTSQSWNLPGNMVRQVPAGSVRRVGTIKCITSNGGAMVGTTTVNFTAEIPPDALSVDSTSVTLGGNRTFTTTILDSGATNIKHKLTYTCGSATGTIKNPSATSETWTVPKSLAGQAAANASTVSISVTLATYNGTALVGSKQVTITGTIPASTIAAHTFTIGQAGTVTISRAASNLAHMVYYTFYNEVNQAAVNKTTAETLTWTPKMSLCNQLPNAASGTGTIYVVTYNGTTQIGTAQSAALTLKVPASVVPTDLSITTVIQNTNANLNSWGIAVAGYSTVKSTVAATSAYGSAITARKVTFGGQSGNAALSGGSYVWTSAKLSESGSITPKLSMTDARGRTATKNGSAITVYAYAIPKMTTATAFRSDSGGTKDKQGAYVTVKLAGSVTSLGNRNTATLRARYKQASGGSWSAYTTLTNGTAKTINWSLSATVGYVVELSISDTVGNAVTRTISIPPDVVTLHMRQGGLGVGVGMYSQGAERLDVAWNTHFERVVRPNLLSSHDESASGFRSYVWICPRYTQTDLGISSEGSPFSTYLEAWIKKVCEDFAGRFDAPYLTIMGTANPGVRGTIFCNIRDTTELSGGLPRYSSGAFYPTNGSAEVIRFGTWEYAFFYSVINGNETGSVTYASNSVITSAANLGVTLRKSGKVVTMDFAPTVAAVSTGSSTLKVAQIDDSSFYPQNRVALTVPQQASSFYYCGVYVTAAGEIQILKPNTSSTTVRANLSWITA